jgi:5'-nucleotidase
MPFVSESVDTLDHQSTSPVRLVIAISSRALFDLTESHKVFIEQGVTAYHEYQIQHETEILEPGVAFPLVKKLLALNTQLGTAGCIDIILLSRNSTDTGLRIFNSIRSYQLDVTRAAFTNGVSPYRYIAAFGAHLFLSADPNDVRQALAAGCAAATIPTMTACVNHDQHNEQVRIAFDGDAVLFSDDAEQIFRRDGLAAFNANELAAAHEPLPPGPFKGFLSAVQQLQAHFPATASPLRTALITARGAPSHERVIRTLRAWDIRIDEALFLSGLTKTPFLQAFGADIFFDDQKRHCQAADGLVTTGHVPHGIANQDKDSC